ncbi:MULTISPECIES: SDR family NAD(P)-dependent oxidoreductase [unclassified Streptomyces]|uniref:SDR family NAD(P)-dependent oxidoreductase n=1 Tax=unclassified Streptomyces TaxID=2593676 RepID=UPI0036EDA8DD
MSARHGSRVVVVGAAGALGRAACAALAARGHAVWAADAADPSPALAGLPGGGHHAVRVDVTEQTSVDELLRTAWEGPDARLDGLVYAPGVNVTGPVADLDWPGYERLMDVNLNGAFRTGQALARMLATDARPFGSVFLSSTAGLRGEAGGAAYSASKFGLIGFVQSFAAEIAGYGGRANAVCPGNVDSPMLRRLAAQVAERESAPAEEVLARFADASAFRRLIDPGEVGRVCAWLVSAESSGISGQNLVVDGPPPAG